MVKGCTDRCQVCRIELGQDKLGEGESLVVSTLSREPLQSDVSRMIQSGHSLIERICGVKPSSYSVKWKELIVDQECREPTFGRSRRMLP